MSTKKPLCEVLGDSEAHKELQEEEKEKVTVKVDHPTPEATEVTVTIGGKASEKKEESEKGKHQLLS